MVRAGNKIYKASQDNPAGHSTKKEKERHTEKEIGGQNPGMEGAGCQVNCGAPMVHQTTGYVKV